MKKLFIAAFIIFVVIISYMIQKAEQKKSNTTAVIGSVITKPDPGIASVPANEIEKPHILKNPSIATVDTVDKEKLQKEASTYYKEQMKILNDKSYIDHDEPIYQDQGKIFLNINGEHKLLTTDKSDNFGPELSHDKTYYSYESSIGLVIGNINQGDVLTLDKDASSLFWHPNQESFVFMRTKDDGSVLTEGKIYLYNLENQKEIALLENSNRILHKPIFSEDGLSVYAMDETTDEIIIIDVKQYQ